MAQDENKYINYHWDMRDIFNISIGLEKVLSGAGD